MRGPKPRAWSKSHDAYCDFVTFDETGEWVGWFRRCGIYLKDNDIILEFPTGLKDKNGEEIYVGDVVRYFDDEEQITEAVIKQKDGDTENGYWIIGIVYEPLRIVSEEDLTEEEYENLCGFEVVSNIHENPELLEAKA